MLHVHVLLVAPLGARHMAQSRADQHQGGISIRDIRPGASCIQCPDSSVPVGKARWAANSSPHRQRFRSKPRRFLLPKQKKTSLKGTLSRSFQTCFMLSTPLHRYTATNRHIMLVQQKDLCPRRTGIRNLKSKRLALAGRKHLCADP